jgi:hypothetical protein
VVEGSAARARISWYASGADKWSTCTMAPAMERDLPDELSEFNHRREHLCPRGRQFRLSKWLGGSLRLI